MRILLFVGCLALLSHSVTAQITFEKGYFVRNDGTRVECLIKNIDWEFNPTEFQYKVGSEEAITISVLDVTEFGVYEQSKYKTLTVNIDRSIFKMDERSTKNPVFQKETLALKVLTEGTADLYSYERTSLKRFFFGINDNTIEQLVYKEYLVEGGRIAKNELFKQQLWLNVKCGDVAEQDIKRLRYRKEDLLAYFKEFNRCSGDQPVQEIKKKTNNVFIKLTPGVGISTLKVKNYDYQTWFNKEFSNGTTYHLAAEVELILPFNKNKWSVLFEPSFNTFSDEQGNDAWGNKAKLNTFEGGLGLRHYFFLSQHSKVFLNGMIVFYVPLQESITYLNLQAMSNFGVALGGGYSYKRLSAEIRYYFDHQVLGNYGSWGAKQSKNILVLGYRIF